MRAVWFPMEQRWMVHDDHYLTIDIGGESEFRDKIELQAACRREGLYLREDREVVSIAEAPPTIPPPDFSNWSDDKLRRKMDQAWEMAGLARQDGDTRDAERRMKEAEQYRQELRNRR
jgi:hypothetical protein